MRAPAPSPRRKRRRRVLARVLLAGAGLVAAVAVAEAAMWTFDLFGVRHGPNTLRYRTEALRPTWFDAQGTRDLDGTLFRHKPSTTTSFGPFHITTNALGFRGPEVAVPKPEGTFRIVVLGDSVTLGWGIDDEVTFCRRVERTLNARGDGRRYEVVNTGHLSYDSMQEAALFEREALALAPDLVLLVFVTNDVVEPTHLLVQAFLDGAAAPSGQEPTLVDRLRHQGERMVPALTALCTNLAARWSSGGTGGEGGNELDPTMVPAGPDGWARSQSALRRIRDRCAERAIPLLVLDHSLPRLPVLRTFCDAEGIPWHDFGFTPEELGSDIYNSLIDTHANAYGNELLAGKALRILGASGVLPR